MQCRQVVLSSSRTLRFSKCHSFQTSQPTHGKIPSGLAEVFTLPVLVFSFILSFALPILSIFPLPSWTCFTCHSCRTWQHFRQNSDPQIETTDYIQNQCEEVWHCKKSLDARVPSYEAMSKFLSANSEFLHLSGCYNFPQWIQTSQGISRDISPATPFPFCQGWAAVAWPRQMLWSVSSSLRVFDRILDFICGFWKRNTNINFT